MGKIKINIQDKQIVQALKKLPLVNGASGTGWLHDLNSRNDLKEGDIGTIEMGDGVERRIYDCYLYETPGMMRDCHHHSKWSIRFRGRPNEADRLERIEAGKWLLGKGVITPEQARNEYGYVG